MQKSLKLTDLQLFVLETMADNNARWVKDIAEYTGKRESQIARMLDALHARGLVEYTGTRAYVLDKGVAAIKLSRELRNGHATFAAAHAEYEQAKTVAAERKAAVESFDAEFLPKRGYHEMKVVTPSVDDIMRYENGEMDEAEQIEFFQRLVDTGLAWQLQGSYGRTANDLLRAGLISKQQ